MIEFVHQKLTAWAAEEIAQRSGGVYSGGGWLPGSQFEVKQRARMVSERADVCDGSGEVVIKKTRRRKAGVNATGRARAVGSAGCVPESPSIALTRRAIESLSAGRREFVFVYYVRWHTHRGEAIRELRVGERAFDRRLNRIHGAISEFFLAELRAAS